GRYTALRAHEGSGRSSMTSHVLNYSGPCADDNSPPDVRGVTFPHTVGDRSRQVADAETTRMRFGYSRCDPRLRPLHLAKEVEPGLAPQFTIEIAPCRLWQFFEPSHRELGPSCSPGSCSLP